MCLQYFICLLYYIHLTLREKVCQGFNTPDPSSKLLVHVYWSSKKFSNKDRGDKTRYSLI